MAREIRFRAWDGGKMLTPDYIADDGVACYWSDCRVGHRKAHIVMQFTGLLDKNGKEIYEGDIIQWDTSDYSDLRCAVSFCPPSFTLPGDDGGNLEIIGNIYENPELLGGPK